MYVWISFCFKASEYVLYIQNIKYIIVPKQVHELVSSISQKHSGNNQGIRSWEHKKDEDSDLVMSSDAIKHELNLDSNCHTIC